MWVEVVDTAAKQKKKKNSSSKETAKARLGRKKEGGGGGGGKVQGQEKRVEVNGRKSMRGGARSRRYAPFFLLFLPLWLT